MFKQKHPMSFESDLLNFANSLEKNRDAASDLWSWLPSYRKAKDCMGDYCFKVMPSIADIMIEATIYISSIKKNISDDFTIADPYFQCPCLGDCPKQEA